MPEGDTVWNTAAVLQRAIGGATVTGSQFRVPQLAAADLSGWRVRESASRGKHLLLRLDPPTGPAQTLHSHLRMEGAWRAYDKGRRWGARPAHTIRVVLRTTTKDAVGFHLHEVALLPTDREGDLVGHLGPDLLGPDWDAEEAVRRLAAHPDLAIGDALLDQRNLAGIGNMYKAELLFLRGVSPWTPVGEVGDLRGLVDLAHRVLGAHRGRFTQSTTGSQRRGETMHVYGRRAAPCRRCGTAIAKAEPRAGSDRVTYWCPRCQPGPSRATNAAGGGATSEPAGRP